jgi:hypothetical protein
MDDITYVGLDVHKATGMPGSRQSGRGGEVRQIGVSRTAPRSWCKMAAGSAREAVA